MQNSFTKIALCLFGFLISSSGNSEAAETRPNVILVMTDDQGFASIDTPAVSRLAADSVRLTNYHVDPTCSPTRAALMTGRYSSRTGVWHTIMGRSILRKDETTMAQIFAQGGYRTGIFGKWHLGDNYPYRPQDRGFQEVLIHGGGGVGQTPDAWGNDYFDDTYFHNGRPEKFNGYCTDVWFEAASKFIEANKDHPFFAYIPTNAPHSPYVVDKRYSDRRMQRGESMALAAFNGMIDNIDENLARLEDLLERLRLKENTILIFTTDNGSPPGMRPLDQDSFAELGDKGSQYDGGHHVPFYLRWPAGKLNGGRDVDSLTAHIDVLPTLMEFCNLSKPDNLKFDGVSLVPLLTGKAQHLERTLFVHSQRIDHPEKWRQSAVMTDRWRLIDGQKLYDTIADPGQRLDISLNHPELVVQLRAAYDQWWAETSTRFDEDIRIELGSPNANPVSLTCHDWHAPLNMIPWDQRMVAGRLKGNGVWAVEIVRAGRYEVTLRDRPAGIPFQLAAQRASIKVGELEREQPVARDAESVTFTVELKAGPAELQTWLESRDGTSHGAYFVDVKFVE